MIDDLKPYPDYKESGLPWLGQVPAHWQVRRNGQHFAQRNETGRAELPILEVSLKTGVRIRDFTGSKRKQIMSDRAKYKRAGKGDIAYNMMRLWQGAVGVAPVDGLVSPAYVVARPLGDTIPEYFTYLFRTAGFMDEVNSCSRGIVSDRNRLYWVDFKQISTPSPPPDEQAAIVRFLDHANWRVEGFIRTKRKVIALLNEQKQTIIHRAVTPGLDTAAKLKPSGVRWLDDIPEHWGILRSKRLFAARKEFALPDDVQLSATQTYGVIPQAEFEERVGRRVVKISMHLEKRRHVEKDDFVISMRSFQGGLERAWASGAIRSSYVVLKPEKGVDVGYFQYLFKSAAYIRALQGTADFIRDGQDLNYRNFCEVDLPVVPPDEQKAIAGLISRELTETESAIAHTEREIALIREYRTRLITDVVTGKLDVRTASAVLLDDAEELPPDDADEIDDTEAQASEDDP